MRGWPVPLCKATPQVGSGHSQTHPTGSLSADSLLLASSWDGIETELPLRVPSGKQTSWPRGDSGFRSAPCLSPHSSGFQRPTRPS